MTTIAWDGETLAADKAAINNGLKRTVTKIFKVDENTLIGFSGDATFGMQLLHWYQNGVQPHDFPKAQQDKDDWIPFLVIRRNTLGELLPIEVYERTPHPILFEDKCFAMGSGRDFALGAMHAGCTAREAVRIACELDAGSG